MKKILCIAVIGVIFVFGFFFVRDNIGVSADKLEADARESQRVDEEWLVSKSVSEEIAVMVFYPEGLDEHVFSVYAPNSGLSFGYFFKAGGKIYMDESVSAFCFNETYAYCSMNKIGISEVEVFYRERSEKIKIDSKKPFAFALPDGAVTARFYDSEGKSVETVNMPEFV